MKDTMDDATRKLKGILANTSLFQMLDDGQLDEIVANTSSMRVDPNTRIVNQGDAAAGAFWVVYGQVQIGLYNKQGGEKTLEILGQGKCFGLGEMLLDLPHQAFAKTIVDSMLLHTERATMLKIAQENSAFSHALMVCVGRQFYALVRDIGSYAQSARQRLAGYLLRQSQRDNSAEIELIANKTLIASRLSLTPETLSRLFHDFTKEGMINVTGRHITLLDCEKLSSLIY